MLEQARALLWIRATLYWRRLREGGRGIFTLFGLLLFGAFSAMICWATLEYANELAAVPAKVAARGGPLALFGTWLGLAIVGRLWFSLVSTGQESSWFLDPRRFKQWPIPPRLLSALNFAALLFEPGWLLLYPVLATIAVGIAQLQGAPRLWALLVAEALTVFATVGLLHFGAAVGAAFDARPLLRRALSIVLVFAGFAGFQLAAGGPHRKGLAGLFAQHQWQLIAWTPPGWAALLAKALSDLQPLHALTPALLLVLVGLVCAVLAHELSVREVIRPQETKQAPESAVRGAGWQLPFAGPVFSALFEKEMKTALRIGWLQLVLVPVAFLLLRMMVVGNVLGQHPLMVAAAYAHLGVLELTTNAYGRDVEAARAWFLWPVSRRRVIAAKNAVAYVFSLLIFGLLVAVALATGSVPPGELGLALLAHAALFPLLATVGNVASAYVPSPVRGARLRRVRGGGPIGARFGAMFLLIGAVWAPWAIAAVTGLPRSVAYLSELFAMLVAYGGLLGFAAHVLERRKEPLLAALRRDE